MPASFANRLAGGGYWALCVAHAAHEMTQELNDQGFRPPVGDGTPYEAYIHCGVAAFELVCNANTSVSGGLQMHARPVMRRLPVTFNRQGEQIPFDLWTKLHADEVYKRVAQWQNDVGGKEHVSTIWTGIDHSSPYEAVENPDIFETVVVREHGDHYHLTNQIRTPTEADAMECHNAMVAAVIGGFL